METENRSKVSLWIIAGPTASGKSGAAVELARLIGGEVISGDSMQVYRGMDIGTAKITPEEMKGVPHHLIDVADPWEPWSVALFTQKAEEAIAGIRSRGRVPIVAGGTGFYLHALAYKAEFGEEDTGGAVRQELMAIAREQGPEALWKELLKADPESAQAIHPNNVKRVARALEYFRQNGEPISAHNARLHEKESPYRLHFFAISLPRQEMYRRIDERVDEMIRGGLVEEVRRLLAGGCRRDMVSMQGLGYKEIIDHLEGRKTLEEAVQAVKLGTRHFAKRQMTWLRRERLTWVERKPEDTSLSLAERMLSLADGAGSAAEQKSRVPRL